MLPGRGIDALGVYLTGGADNSAPDLSLGGAASAARAASFGAIVSGALSPVIIDFIWGAPGAAEIASAAGKLSYAAAGDSAGTAVSVADGDSRILLSSGGAAAALVTRAGAALPDGALDLNIVRQLNSAAAMADVSDAARVFGVTTYRALMLRAHGDYGVLDVRAWVSAVAGAQADIEIGLEPADEAGEIQTIADEFTPPAGVSFYAPTEKAAALCVPLINPGNNYGLWLKRIFPSAGSAGAFEVVRIVLGFLGA